MAIDDTQLGSEAEDLAITDTSKGTTNIDPVDVIVEGEEPAVEEQVEDDFNKNIAEDMDERDLQDLANQLVSDFKNDKLTREDWEQSYTKGLDLLGFKYTLQTRPFQGASGVTHPLLCLLYTSDAADE